MTKNIQNENAKTQQTNSPRLASWRVYPKLSVDEVVEGDKIYRFFVEIIQDTEPQEHTMLPLEFFNHELQRVDTTSEKSLQAFCKKWGLVFSPLYASKTHAMCVRNTCEPLSYSYYYPTCSLQGIKAVKRRLAEDISCFRGSCGFNSTDKAAELLIGSEIAREAIARGDFGNPTYYGAVVSVDEVAYTIRLLQIATAMQAAFASGLSGKDLSIYLLNNRLIPRRHPIELEEKTGEDLFFANSLIASALLRQQESIEGYTLGNNEEDIQENIKKRMGTVLSIAYELGIENCRSFTRQSTLNLAMENAWVREEGANPGNDKFWDLETHFSEGSIMEAILANFNYVMDSELEWITCEHCERIFKFQKEYDPSNRYRKSTFCKNSCRVMNAQAIARETKSNISDLASSGESQRN